MIYESFGQSVSIDDQPGYQSAVTNLYIDPLSDPVEAYRLEKLLDNTYTTDENFQKEIALITGGGSGIVYDGTDRIINGYQKAEEPSLLSRLFTQAGSLVGGKKPDGTTEKPDYTPALVIGGLGVAAVIVLSMR